MCRYLEEDLEAAENQVAVAPKWKCNSHCFGDAALGIDAESLL